MLITDETNRTLSDKSRFFIYGGLILPANILPELTARIDEIRRTTGLSDGDALKFDTRSRPAHVPIDEYTSAKNAVIETCISLNVRFISYLVLHAIARNQKPEELMRRALNSVLYVFDRRVLTEENAYGLCIVDRMPEDKDLGLLREKFSKGALMSTNDQWVKWPRINLYAATCDGASHVSSAMDIVLGAFRYCVNEGEKLEVPKKLLPRIIQMMYHRREGGNLHVRDHGLILRPQQVHSVVYQDEYDALVQRFTLLLRS